MGKNSKENSNKNVNKDNLKCETPGCNETVGERSITGLCKGCYAYIYNWGKKTPGALVQRANKLSLYESRMRFLLPSSVKLFNQSTNNTPLTLTVMPGQVKKYRRKTKTQYKTLNQNHG